MPFRIEVISTVPDARAQVRKDQWRLFPFAKKIKNIFLSDNYSTDIILSQLQYTRIAGFLANPVSQKYFIKRGYSLSGFPDFDFAVEIGFLPGVTDNIGNTVTEMAGDYLKRKFSANQKVYYSQTTFIKGLLNLKQVGLLADSLCNPLIQSKKILSYSQLLKTKGFAISLPKVKLTEKTEIKLINLDKNDRYLTGMGESLSLSLEEIKTIRRYFAGKKRKPTDIELESLAQTWSEHCRHKIFNSPLSDSNHGLFNRYIFSATKIIRRKKGKKDGCLSVFTDNSGAFSFDKDFAVTHKVETHNTPSALDPFGGALTGIVGVNRDTIGFGLGAKPIANIYGFCFAPPSDEKNLFRDNAKKQPLLSSNRIISGVIAGVNNGGNQSGIPTPLGFIYFHEKYRAKPLVFVGTVGLIPKKNGQRKLYLKKAIKGDYLIMVGGKVGKDGIHGATFSSKALDPLSPSTAVQIGDPITQKKFSDAIVKEARDQDLYNSITDNGAGGLSCSVSEMARESNGCEVYLDAVPLKYPGLKPWEIWISESQERMTLAVAPEKWPVLQKLCKSRDVGAWKIGKFTSTGKCLVFFHGKKIMDVDLEFLHNGWPRKRLIAENIPFKPEIRKYFPPPDYNSLLLNLIKNPNFAGYSFISEQFDHTVQGNSVIAPLIGKGRINSTAVAVKPLPDSQKAIALSCSLYPEISEADPLNMARSALDTAVRNIICLGADPQQIYLLDNFCWCQSDKPERLNQLQNALKGLQELAIDYQTPFISGKDSMFNDFSGFDHNGKKVNLSVLPTLLISSIGVVRDIRMLTTSDGKMPGDLVYILGQTDNELAGSQYLSQIGQSIHNGIIPQVNSGKNLKLYLRFYKALRKGLISSSCSIGRGGLAMALVKTALGGLLGLRADLGKVRGKADRDDFILFSQSQGRILVSIDPAKKNNFEYLFQGIPYAEIGKLTESKKFIVTSLNGNNIINLTVNSLFKYYHSFAQGYS